MNMKFPPELSYIVINPIFQKHRWCSDTCFQKDDLCRLILLGKLAYYKISCFFGHNNLDLMLQRGTDTFRGGLRNKSDVLYLTYYKDRPLTYHLGRHLFKFQFHFHFHSSEFLSSLFWIVALTFHLLLSIKYSFPLVYFLCCCPYEFP